MHFPVFEMPLLGNRWLIGAIAIFHVLINHGAAVGGSLLVTMLERKGLVTGDPRWEQLAYRLAKVFFVLTTTVGALSGVGIWFAVMVVQPTAIATLLRIFFWGWFVEWLVFVGEVLFVLVYFMSWNRFRSKIAHVRLGFAYAGFSFVTMTLIVGILGAMLTPDRWLDDHNFWNGFLNSSYLPQLITRIGIALGLAGALALVLVRRLAEPDLRPAASRYVARFLVASVPFLAIGGLWYLSVLPETVRGHIATALMTTRFASWVEVSWYVNGVLSLVLLQFALWAALSRRMLPKALVALPLLVIVAQVGQFERVREFVRKPFVIHGYLYSNGIRVDQVPRLQREGFLPHARFAEVHAVTPANTLAAGRELYRLQCASCHTIGGLNDIGRKFPGLAAPAIDAWIGAMHVSRPFMPPFVGTPAERSALAAYIAQLNTSAPATPDERPLAHARP